MSFVVLDTGVASAAFRGSLPGRLHARLATLNTKDFAAYDGLGLVDVT